MLYNLFYCEHCSEVFSNTTGDFTEHMASHSVKKKKPLKCSDCNKSFNSRSGLFKHRKNHISPKPYAYTCKYCKQKFADQKDWENHKIMHGEKPYKCSDCDKSFRSPSGMYKHRISHTIPKPYACKYCKQVFAEQKHCDTHMKFHTDRNKTYECEVCNKKFNHRQSLLKHLRVHAGQKPYPCEMCKKKFVYKKALQLHYKKHHTDENSEKCEVSPVPVEIALKDHVYFQVVKSCVSSCETNDAIGSSIAFIKNKKSPTKKQKSNTEKADHIGLSTETAIEIKKLKSTEKTYCMGLPTETHLVNSTIERKTLSNCIDTGPISPVPDTEFYITQGPKSEEVYNIVNSENNAVQEKDVLVQTQNVIVEEHYETYMEDSHERDFQNSKCMHTVEKPYKSDTEFYVTQGPKGEEVYNIVSSENNAVQEKDFLVQTQNVNVEEHCEIYMEDSHERDFQNSKCMHTVEKPYKCNYCGKSFHSRSGLFKHHKLHPDPNSYECKFCERVFADPKHWEYHKKKPKDNNEDVMHIDPKSNDKINSIKSGSIHERMCRNLTGYPENHVKELAVLSEDVNNVKSQISPTEYEGSFINDLQTNSVCFGDHFDYPQDFTDSVNDHIYGKEELKNDSIDSEKRIQPNEKKTFSCSHCSRTFDSSKYLLRHLLLHMGKNVCPCKHCSRKAEIRKQSIHLRSVLKNNISHGIDSGQVCDQDENISNNHDNINQIPSKQGTLPSNPEFHLNIFNAKNIYKCKECNKSYTCKQRMTYHKLKVHESMYSCKVCFKQFYGQMKYKEHLVVHEAEQATCQYCHKSFRRKRNLVEHLKVHSGEKPHSCTYCEKSFREKNTLLTHMKIHTGKDLHPCNYCEKKFVHKFGLSEHIRVHTGEKPFVCPHCHKAFNRIFTYTLHLKMHTIARPFPCLYCKKSFATKRHRDNHLKFHEHNRNKILEKVFSCSFCTKTFSLKDRFEKHVQTHTGDRYSCPNCDKKFTYAKNLRRHAIAVHKIPFKDTLETKLVKQDKPIECPDDALTLLLQLAEIPATDVYIQTT